MHIKRKMPETVRTYFRQELLLSRIARQNGDLTRSWLHLERAHILGQSWAGAHTRAHWEMLKFGFASKEIKEIIGQLPRLAFGGIKSFVGMIPTGNTGGSNMSMLAKAEIDKDLLDILNGLVKQRE